MCVNSLHTSAKGRTRELGGMVPSKPYQANGLVFTGDNGPCTATGVFHQRFARCLSKIYYMMGITAGAYHSPGLLWLLLQRLVK